MRVKQQEREEYKCYMIWQMVVATLYSNGQLRTDGWRDTEKGCQKPALQQKTTAVTQSTVLNLMHRSEGYNCA